MKRKVITGIMSLAMMAVVDMPVHAVEKSVPDAKSTTITTNVESKYELTIPAETNINFNNVKTQLSGELKVTGNVKPNEVVNVSVQKGSLENQDNRGNTIQYELKKEDAVFSSDSWNEAALRAGDKSVGLSIAIEEGQWNSAKAGRYSGNITFTAELK